MKRLSLGLLATAVALGLSTPSIAVSPAATTDTDALARALGIAADRLLHVSASDETLLDGRELHTVKAIDGATGEPVGQTFSNGVPVDANRLRDEAGANWRMLATWLMKRSLALPLLVLCAATAVAGGKGKASDTIHNDKTKMEGKAPSDADLVASAMKAAPASVAKNATVIGMDAKGMRTVRKGSNGFTCMGGFRLAGRGRRLRCCGHRAR